MTTPLDAGMTNHNYHPTVRLCANIRLTIIHSTMALTRAGELRHAIFTPAHVPGRACCDPNRDGCTKCALAQMLEHWAGAARLARTELVAGSTGEGG